MTLQFILTDLLNYDSLGPMRTLVEVRIVQCVSCKSATAPGARPTSAPP